MQNDVVAGELNFHKTLTSVLVIFKLERVYFKHRQKQNRQMRDLPVLLHRPDTSGILSQ